MRQNSLSASELAKYASGSVRWKKKDDKRPLDKFATLSLGVCRSHFFLRFFSNFFIFTMNLIRKESMLTF